MTVLQMPAEDRKPTPEQKLNTAIKENTPDVTAVPYRQLYTIENEREKCPLITVLQHHILRLALTRKRVIQNET
jgi:hypothetical protein